MKMANTNGACHLQKHKDSTMKIHNLNNLADVPIHGQRFNTYLTGLVDRVRGKQVTLVS